METTEISMELIKECGFYTTHEFNRTTFKNMITLHGIHDNIPNLVKKPNGDTVVYGNVNLTIQQVDGLPASFYLTIAKQVKRKYKKQFQLDSEMLIRVENFVDVQTTKEKIRTKLHEFYKINGIC